MRNTVVAALATSALALSACSMEGGETASSSSVAATSVVPDFASAVAAPGRAEADVKLDTSRRPAEVLAFAGLERGDTVLDIFSGGGYYSEILARAVGPEGNVVAHNAGVFGTDEKGMAKWAGIKSRNPQCCQHPRRVQRLESSACKF